MLGLFICILHDHFITVYNFCTAYKYILYYYFHISSFVLSLFYLLFIFTVIVAGTMKHSSLFNSIRKIVQKDKKITLWKYKLNTYKYIIYVTT